MTGPEQHAATVRDGERIAAELWAAAEKGGVTWSQLACEQMSRTVRRLVALAGRADELERRLRDAPLGGDGSHWVDCWRSHIDCAVHRVEAAEARARAASERPDIDRLQSKLRSFIYGEWGSIGDERARPLLAALDELVDLAGRAAWLEDELDECDKRADKAEARADELQRERDEWEARCYENIKERQTAERVRDAEAKAVEMSKKFIAAEMVRAEQARREADQLREKLDRLANVESTWELLQQNDRLRAALEEIAGTDFQEPSDFSELGRIARAALAGVQAEDEYCVCGHILGSPECCNFGDGVQADNKDAG